MPSHFSWIDFSTKERDSMMNVVNLFREQDTRDELGIGSIRDAFANYFFPGTSTIQTRSRYMLFVPWLYLELERKGVKSAEIANKIRYEEMRLLQSLMNNNEHDGLIGRIAGKTLIRLPSNIYWAGLGSLGIRTFPGNQYQYHRYLDDYYYKKKNQLMNDDKEPIFGKVYENWHPGIPPMPEDLFENAKLSLLPDEAEYLNERILSKHPDSLLAFLVSSNNNIDVDNIWNESILEKIPEKLIFDIKQAQKFSESINGAALLYNLMLSEKRGNRNWREDYHERILNWSEIISEQFNDLMNWTSNIESFWSSSPLNTAQIHPLTKMFVNEWLTIIINKSQYRSLHDSGVAREIIIHRERMLKRSRARLENQRALELWSGDSGTRMLDYRWGVVSKMINDIIDGLHKGELIHA